MKSWLPIVSALLLALAAGGCAEDGGSQAPSAPAAAGEGGQAVFRVTYTGKPGQTTDELRQSALEAAAEAARGQGHSHFAVIEEGPETVTGSGPAISSVGVRVPVTRSERRRRRGGPSGTVTSIELGQARAPAYVLRITPFSGAAPENAVATYPVSDFQ